MLDNMTASRASAVQPRRAIPHAMSLRYPAKTGPPYKRLSGTASGTEVSSAIPMEGTSVIARIQLNSSDMPHTVNNDPRN